jgi:NDP-4-keto-2,6-dideoxyhexose 3-C-methyltransferase
MCGNADLQLICDLGNQVLTGVFPSSTNQTITRGPLRLVRCDPSANPSACGLVQLNHTYDATEMYGDNYGYRSGLNRVMVDHLAAKAEGLISLAAPKAGDIVADIGSNDGTLLSFYAEDIERIGIDPTAAKFRQYYRPGIQIVEDFFTAEAFLRKSGG